jgi:hypothetical protein
MKSLKERAQHMIYKISQSTARRAVETIPPQLKAEIFVLLRQNGFAFDEALGLAAEAINRFDASPPQRVFAFGPVSGTLHQTAPGESQGYNLLKSPSVTAATDFYRDWS